MRRWFSPFSLTSRNNAATVRQHATDDSPQSRRSFDRLNSAYPRLWHRHGRSMPSRVNVMTKGWFSISRWKRFGRSSMRQIPLLASGSATVPCCIYASRAGCASRNWWGSRWKTCPSNGHRAFAFSAKAGRNAVFHSGRRQPPISAPGWQSGGRFPCLNCSSMPRDSAMSRAGFEYVLDKHVCVARTTCTTLSGRSISPHQLRHSRALTMLQATRDIRKVALWLGHADIRTTEICLRVDPTEKLEAVEAVLPLGLRRGRFKAPDALIASLFEPG